MAILTGGGGGNRERSAQAINQILEILKHPLRRDILDCLGEAESRTMTVDDLVDLLEQSGSGTADEREELAMQLFHVQLPKLAKEGTIEFDPRSGLVRYQPDDDLEAWLDRVQDWVSE